MAFESVVCTVCRATESFTRVEPDTYYCPYHKGLFKWTDLDRNTVKSFGYFCPCGNRVDFQCQLCQTGCCAECDAIEAQNRLLNREDPRDESREQDKTHRHVIIPVRGFGYWELIHFAKVWMISGNRVKSIQISSPVIGPFLSLGDIRPQLSADPGRLRHACCECVGKKVPLTVEAIVTGRICEHPGCGATPAERCRCCGHGFCMRHFTGNISPARRDPVLYYSGKRFRAPSQAGLCAMCGDESKIVAQEKIDALMAGNPLGRMFGLERKVNELIEEIDRAPRICSRSRVFDQEVASYRVSRIHGPLRNRAYASLVNRDFLISTYTVVDERDRASPERA